ncbi:zinc metalloprotease [Ruegeria sp. ANG-R]|uniref:M48 family metallopeptidase n=1 Tax=Ruegeria sp. ANG-R TaxID=1577903 RepID=UPI00057EFBC8|nr:SprT family zinc-dependent metalloprotease [Ruegeria sp. ANG-R]KIC40355.1 zinc metalloprotease [Ruegeria sp. ANG-R]
MGRHALPGTPPVPLTLRKSARARRISLRISQLDGRVTLTYPTGVAENEALNFAQQKEDWIRGHLQDRPIVEAVGVGQSIPIEGTVRRIVSATGRRVLLRSDEIGVPPGAEARRLARFLKELARDRLTGACDDYAAILGRPYSSLTLRDTRSRWGSCSSTGGLMFSWRLILAPSDVLHYVAAHEVAHLAEMNHSPAFWAQVERIYGPYKESRRWLRENGADLHRYRFDAPG